MKRTYIISFLLFMMLLIAAYITGYYVMKGQVEKNMPEKEANLEKSMADMGKYTSDQTVYILENYYMSEERLTQEKIPMPADYVGCTREELLEKVQNYAENPSPEDTEKGLKNFDMVCFSSNKLVLRKTYDSTENNTAYQVRKIQNGTIAVYYADSEQIYTETDILYNSLPDAVKNQIDSGKKLYGLQEVFDFLENYSS